MLRRAAPVAVAVVTHALLWALPSLGDAPPERVGADLDGLPSDDGVTALSPDAPPRSAAVEAPIPFTMVGFGLPEGVEEVEFRTSTDGDAWTDWQEVERAASDGDGPDPGGDEERAADAADWTRRTEPVWVGEAVWVQVRGADPGEVEAHFVDADGLSQGSASLSDRLGDAVRAAVDALAGAGRVAEASTGMPDVVTRAQWGADESWRSGTPRTADAVELGIVHHTAGSNTYTEAQAPAVVRAIYHYHTQVLGWSDIGYNFLVDRFGTVYEGRAGGMTAGVVGAHARGFNTGSVGVSVLGEFTNWTPAWVAQEAVADVLAWQFAVHGIDPTARVTFTSGGSNLWSAGIEVDLPTIIGHRDVGRTACPGDAYYGQLPALRNMVDDRMGDIVDAAAALCLPEGVAGQYPVRLSAPDGPKMSATAALWYWGAGTEEAILASAEDYADALAGAVLSASRDAPLLLTGADRLDGDVAERLRALDVEQVTLLGGTAALAPAVEDGVAALGIDTDRLWGADRFGTAAAIAGEVGPAPGGEVAIALGRHEEFRRAWPDAMSAASLAATPDRVPTLLTRIDRVPSETLDALDALGVTRVHLLGGTAAISADVARDLGARGLDVVRHAGEDRYGTSLAVVEEALGRFGPEDRPLVLSGGESYPNAVVAGAVAARRGGPMLLVPDCGMEQAREVETYLADSPRLIGPLLVGSVDDVSERVRWQLSSIWPDAELADADRDDPAEDLDEGDPESASPGDGDAGH